MRWRRWLLAAAALAVVGACAALALAPASLASAQAAARARWEARPFRAYHLVVEVRDAAGQCSVDIDIHDEQTVMVRRDTCWRLQRPYRMWRRGVTGLFGYLDDLRVIYGQGCKSLMIVCENYRIAVGFDPDYGFPREVTVYERARIWSSWANAAFWQKHWEAGRWPEIFDQVRTTVRVTEFTPASPKA